MVQEALSFFLLFFFNWPSACNLHDFEVPLDVSHDHPMAAGQLQVYGRQCFLMGNETQDCQFNWIKYYTIKFRPCTDFQSECFFTLLFCSCRFGLKTCRFVHKLCTSLCLCCASYIYLDPIKAYTVICFNQTQFLITVF